jgi:RNA polymerase sigma factor (sigma-70 family)
MDSHYIRQVLAGDTDAFRYFIRTYRDTAFSIAMSMLKDENSAKEVVNDAFVNAYKALPKFKQSSKFSTWFYRIVVNEAFLRLKHRKMEKIDFVDDYAVEPAAGNLILPMEVRERTILINQALDRLPTDESLVLRLFYLEECSIKDVEAITGWSSSKVKVSLHRARLVSAGILILTFLFLLEKVIQLLFRF